MSELINYAERFLEFLGMLPGAESLDDLAILAPSAPIKRADFLLFERSMIVEVKHLETDPAFKVDAIVERYRLHPSYPLFFGQRTLEAVLEHMPIELREEIRKNVYEAITQAIETGCENANRQIRDTRAHFKLDQASGVVFFLNDRIPILAPDILPRRVHQQMHKRAAGGADRFPEIAYACAISWAHVLRSEDGMPAHPIVLIPGPAYAHPVASGQLDYILTAWSRHTNALVREAGGTNREKVAGLEKFTSALSPERASEMRRQDAWRMAYQAQRYLALMSIDELMAHGQKVFAELRPHFIKEEMGQGDLTELLQGWSEFMEECQLRNLDMRMFRPDDRT